MDKKNTNSNKRNKNKSDKSRMNKHKYPFEIIIGLVAPLGSDKDKFKENLKEKFEENGFKFEEVEVVKLLMNNNKNNLFDNLPKSLEYFIKMQVCSHLRDNYCNGVLIKPILDKIKEIRKQNKTDKVVYLIDQLKHENEYKILSYIYGVNYIQVSLFSRQEKRDDFLGKKLKNDKLNCCDDKKKNNKLKTHIKKIINSIIKKFGKINSLKANRLINEYYEKILPNASHKLIKKDFKELDEEFKIRKSGQQVSLLFHKSHYFINLDYSEEKTIDEVNKFVELLLGKYKKYPTQDEFGMALAHQASVRSNFPGNRHIGSSIISEHGEVISVASIRAPSSTKPASANTTLHDQYLIEDGYKHFKKNVDRWDCVLSKILKCDNINECLQGKSKKKDNRILNNNCSIEDINSLKEFIGELIDFHPCTHAEIAAILDAVKQGSSVRNATLYSTTFPCHLCARDIINAGIKKVVYLEAYAKSKNRILYPNLIDFDPNGESTLIPFIFFHGVGPKRFSYFYSLDNKKSRQAFPPLLKAEMPCCFEEKEKDIIEYIENLIKNKNKNTKYKKLSYLDSLILPDKDEDR